MKRSAKTTTTTTNDKIERHGYNRWWSFLSNSNDEISTFNNNHTAQAQSQRVCFYLLLSLAMGNGKICQYSIAMAKAKRKHTHTHTAITLNLYIYHCRSIPAVRKHGTKVFDTERERQNIKNKLKPILDIIHHFFEMISINMGGSMWMWM